MKKYVYVVNEITDFSWGDTTFRKVFEFKEDAEKWVEPRQERVMWGPNDVEDDLYSILKVELN